MHCCACGKAKCASMPTHACARRVEMLSQLPSARCPSELFCLTFPFLSLAVCLCLCLCLCLSVSVCLSVCQDGLIVPSSVADTYFHLASQHRSAWTFECGLQRSLVLCLHALTSTIHFLTNEFDLFRKQAIYALGLTVRGGINADLA